MLQWEGTLGMRISGKPERFLIPGLGRELCPSRLLAEAFVDMGIGDKLRRLLVPGVGRPLYWDPKDIHHHRVWA